MYGPTEREIPYIAELRANGEPHNAAKALIIEHGTTNFDWELTRKAIAANIAPSDLIIAKLESTFATIHAIVKMVDDPAFTEELKPHLLEVCLILVAGVGETK